MEDIATERKKIIDVSDSASALANSDLEVKYCNNKFCSILGEENVTKILGENLNTYFTDTNNTEKYIEKREIIKDTKRTENNVKLSVEKLEDSTLFISAKELHQTEKSKLALKERKEQIEKLHEATLEITKANKREEVYSKIVDTVNNILDIEYCIVGVVKNRQIVYGDSTDTLPEESYEEIRLNYENLDEWKGIKTITHQESILKYENSEDEDYKFESAILVPIGHYGYVGVASFEKYAFDEEQKNLLEILASKAKQKIDQIERREELQERESDLELLKSILSRVLRHNLRNELVVVQGNAEVVQMETEEEGVAEPAQNIIDSSEELLKRTEKARELKTVVDTKDAVESQDIGQIIENSLGRLEGLEAVAIEKTIDYTGDVMAHKNIESAMGNVVENCVEHNEDGVQVEISVDEAGSDEIEIEIRDNGVGIDDYEIEVVEKVDSETDLEHSTGVGLWLVKKIVDASDGRLEIENNDGTTVSITLPKND